MILRRGLWAVFIVLCPLRALAYRPFDQTDADVAKSREIEIELGPVAFLHERGRNSLVPGLVLNFGFTDRLEGVLEGHAGIALGALAPGDERWALEPALLLKAVLREGSLQEKDGPSIALEAGVLLPDVPGPTPAGASLALIISQRWPAPTLHVNLMAERSREGSVDFLGGAIAEGPMDWTVRPVGEFWVARAGDAALTSSLLGGAIWRAREGLSFDTAIRVVPLLEQPAFELRLGLTWTL